MRAARVSILLAILMSSKSALAQTCSGSALKVLLPKVQSLAPDTEVFAQRIRSCPELDLTVYQWMEFWYSIKMRIGEPPKLRPALQELLPKVKTGNVDLKREIEESYRTGIRSLKSKIDSGDPQYSSQPEAYLAVARGLERSGEFDASRSYFIDALRLSGQADDIHMEMLYSYIWEGDLEAAEGALRRVNLSGGSVELRDSISRGLLLIEKIRAIGKDQNQPLAGQLPIFSSRMTVLNVHQEYVALGGQVDYDGPIGLTLQHFRLTNFVYDRYESRRDIFWAGRRHIRYKFFSGHGLLGYRTSATAPILFDFVTLWNFEKKYFLGGTAKRTNLFEDRPLPSSAVDMVQNRFEIQGGLEGRMLMKSAYLFDADRAPFQRHEIALHGAEVKVSSSTGLSPLVQIVYELRNRPSPDYETFRQGLATSLGGHAELKSEKTRHVTFDLAYTNIQNQPHGSPKWVQTSSLNLNFKARQQLESHFWIWGGGHYNALETIRPSQSILNRIGGSAGLDWTQ